MLHCHLTSCHAKLASMLLVVAWSPLHFAALASCRSQRLGACMRTAAVRLVFEWSKCVSRRRIWLPGLPSWPQRLRLLQREAQETKGLMALAFLPARGEGDLRISVGVNSAQCEAYSVAVPQSPLVNVWTGMCFTSLQ